MARACRPSRGGELRCDLGPIAVSLPSAQCARTRSPMVYPATRHAVGVGFALVLASAASAPAAILYLGLPNGVATAYSTRGGRLPVLRAASAEFPGLGRH